MVQMQVCSRQCSSTRNSPYACLSQVSRHPDISSAIIEGERWMIEIDGEPYPSILGPSLDIHLNWDVRLSFDDGDTFTYGPVQAQCKPDVLHELYLLYRFQAWDCSYLR